MAEVDGTLIVSILQKMQVDMADMKSDIRDLKLRGSIVDGHLAGVMASLGLANEKSDRIADRLERIERRLELVDAH